MVKKQNKALALIASKNNKGFTLIEITITLSLILIIATGVTLGFRQSQQRSLNQASLQMQADLRYIQRRSIIEGRRYGIHFEPGTNSYSLVTITRIGNNFMRGELIRTVNFSNGVILRGSSGGNLIYYTPRGTASTPTTISLSNGSFWQQTTITVGGGRVRVGEII